ncbi:MAG: DUF1553 domain-containing protein [Gemmataceae bacterium]|nr:DUF1553 domain-containing protein [Gemmataceae bacterium]GIW85309.1 MAG: hypothetical protein KatS3mg107_0969 [Gemmataceae bacterium]
MTVYWPHLVGETQAWPLRSWYRWVFPLLAVIGGLPSQGLAQVQRQDGPSIPPEPMFTRHIVPLLSRLGCNGGACHGAVQGKGGLRLSLFGAEPESDYDHLSREFSGRRLNLLDPAASLFLLKPSGQVNHEGGVRLAVGSREYQYLYNWIAKGARLDPWDSSRLIGLKVTPASHTVRPGEEYRLHVEASFSDGSREEVTELCVFESHDPAVAEVDQQGRVRAIRPGDAALVIRYRSEPVVAMLLVSSEAKVTFPQIQEHNFIDKHVLNKLRQLGIPPADLCDDVTFLRRVSLDVTGALPTPEEIRAFVESKDPEKRRKKIEELLNRPGYSAVWATKFCDLLRPRISYDTNRHAPEPASVRRFYSWIRARLEENTPYDELVARILTATSLEGRSREEWINEAIALAAEERKGGELKIYNNRRTLDLYWHRFDATGVKGTIQIAHAFLGLRLQCAECHRHPHDVWTQDDLLSFANFFNRLRANTGVLDQKQAAEVTRKAGSGLTAEEKKQLAARLEERDKLRIPRWLDMSAVYHVKGNVFGWATASSTLGTQRSEKFRLLGEKDDIQIPDEQDPREVVVAWLRRPDNPFFAKAIVNRVWAHYFGRGLVDPVDDLSPLNPPSHPELLQELASGFIASKYDLKWLHRTILQSRTYQQSAHPHPANPGEHRYYASFYRRRLPAEVVIDAINHATGSSERYGSGIPAGTRAVELPGRLEEGIITNHFVEHAFTVFGKPRRSPETVCDCERDSLPNLEQSLFMANHPEVIRKISAPTGRVAQIVKMHSNDAKRLEELYLWTLCRLPTEAERRLCLEHLKNAPSAQVGLEGIMWSLLNSSSFLLNY